MLKLHSKEVAEAEVEPRQFVLGVHILNHLLDHLSIHTISWWQTQYPQSGSQLSQSSSPLSFMTISISWIGNQPDEDL